MKLGAEDRKKLGIAGVVGVGALGALVYMYGQLFPSTPPPATSATTPLIAVPARTAPSAPPTGAKVLGTTAAALDPTLHMGPMLLTESLPYRGTGRNIFSSGASAAPASIPRPIRSARPAPVTATPVQVTGPAAPPPINLRFFGTASRAGEQTRAFLLRGEDVVLASVGDIVQRRYKILRITASSVTVQDLTDDRQQMLPLIAN